MKTITNQQAALDSIAPDTVRAWDDHFIIQTPDGALWRCSGVERSAERAESRARELGRQAQLSRIVRPAR